MLFHAYMAEQSTKVEYYFTDHAHRHRSIILWYLYRYLPYALIGYTSEQKFIVGTSFKVQNRLEGKHIP